MSAAAESVPPGRVPPAHLRDGPVFEARQLRKSFAGGRGLTGGRARVRAVDGVSLELRPGETLGLVGESGCGKSTLARMLVGLERPDEGQVLLHGEVLASGGRRRRRVARHVQMVFQDPYTSLNPRLVVADIIGEPLDVHRAGGGRQARHERVGELLELVGLDPALASRFPHEFSGGQRQRIGIARALALDPEVLICDEAVSALDVSVQAQVVNLLIDLQQRLGIAVLFIAHDLAVVRRVAHRVAVMYLGRIVELGEAETVYRHPAHPYTQALLSAVPEPDPRLARERQRIRLEGEPPSPADPPPGCPFHPRCWRATQECRTDPPALVDRTGDGALLPHLSACHHAGHVEDARGVAGVAADRGGAPPVPRSSSGTL